MNPNFFNPTGFFDPTNSSFMNNVFNTVGNSINTAYPFMSGQPQNSYHMEEEGSSPYAYRSYQNTRANVWNDNPPETSGFFRNFENFPQIFHPDNFFSSRPRSSRQTQRQRMPEENSDEFDNVRSTNNPRPKKEENMQELKKQQEKELKKKKVLEAERNQISGHYWKKLGNESFQKGALDQAIQFYTKAIVI